MNNKLYVTLVAFLILCALAYFHYDRPGAVRSNQSADILVLTNKQFNSLVSTMWELSARQWMLDATNEKTIVLALNTNSFDIVKYTDGKCVVTAIPLINPDDADGFARYACDYNCFDIKKADLLAKDGKYSEAVEIYETVIHFNPWALGKPELNNKLALLKKLTEHPDEEENRRQFLQMYDDFDSLTPWSKMAAVEPKFVTNLLSVRAAEVMGAEDW